METIIIKSKIKEVVGDCNISKDFFESLNEVAYLNFKHTEEKAKNNGRKTVQARDLFVAEHVEAPMLIVKSKLKNVVSGYNVSGDMAEGLNQLIVRIIKEAVLTAKANNRKTVRSIDL